MSGESGPTSRATRYVMEHNREAERLERKTDPAESRKQLELVGLATGMKCLDAGSGTGAVAREMAKMAGPEASVVALDASTERLAYGQRLASDVPNLEFVKGDLLELPLDSDAFDFVWCRFVFEYLRHPEDALSHLVRVAKPGGKVVLGDLDGSCLWHFPLEQDLRDGMNRIVDELEGRWDPFAGRKLFSRAKRQGLVRLRAHVLPYNLVAGDASEDAITNWKSKFRTIHPFVAHAFTKRGGYAHFVERFLRAMRSSDLFSYSTLIIIEGRKPSS
jgi:SAM-dependent methyltransferase